MLSDNKYHTDNFPDLCELYDSYSSVLSEKKVEIWHSLLRSHIQPHTSADLITKTAHSLASSSLNTDYPNHFLQGYGRGDMSHDYTMIAGRTAEYLIQLFEKVARNCGESTIVEQSTRTITYRIPTLQVEIPDKALPLAFSFGPSNVPNVDLTCDFQTCAFASVGGNESNPPITVLTCGHSCHLHCLSLSDNKCTVCTPLLLERVRKVSENFNTSLLQPTRHQEQQSNRSELDEHNDEPTISATKDKNHYKSQQFKDSLKNQVNSFPPVQQPKHTRNHQVQFHTQQSPQISSSHQRYSPQLLKERNEGNYQQKNQSLTTSTLNIQIQPAHLSYSVGVIKLWAFPPHVSQSNIDDRNGSNACTLICLILGNSFYNHICKTTNISTINNLPPTWIDTILTSLREGNRVYDLYVTNQGSNLSVVEAANIATYLNIEDIGAEIAVDIVSSDGNSESQTLTHLLLSLPARSAGIFILQGKSVLLLPSPDGHVILFDSHTHGNVGAIMLSCLNRQELIDKMLQYFNSFSNTTNYTLGSLTVVKYT